MKTDDEQHLEQEAIRFVKEHAKDIQLKFADPAIFPALDTPVSIFMAGSPGAGKTEFSKRFIKDSGKLVVRIDPDEVRNLLPQYDRNATLMQRAAALGVEKLYDHALQHKQDLILDGTLGDYAKAKSNISRSIDHNRIVQVYYIYQDPLVAWEFTKKREAIERRGIPKQFFISSFFQSKENVNKLKQEFGRHIQLHLIVKNFENDTEQFELNIEHIDSNLKIEYTEAALNELLT